MAGKQIVLADSGERRFPKKNEHYTFADGPDAGTVFNNENYDGWDGPEDDRKRIVILTVARNDFDPRSLAEKTLARVHEILNAASARRDRAGKDLDKAAHYQQVVQEIALELLEKPTPAEKPASQSAYVACPTITDDYKRLGLHHKVIYWPNRDATPVVVCYCDNFVDAKAIAEALSTVKK
jgi:hypothetical protein